MRGAAEAVGVLWASADCASYEALHPALLGGPFSKGRLSKARETNSC